jgi:molybdate transport system substrate-binding protein
MKSIYSCLLLVSLAASVRAELTVFAAASTTDVMNELASAFQAVGGEKVRFNFASSGALARQIDAGAPADLFVSANTKWMDWLDDKGALVGESVAVVQNTLVLIAPADSSRSGVPAELPQLGPDSSIPGGLLAVGDFRSVPAGAYAESALKSLGLLDGLQGRLVKGTSVRTVLMYVERGETDAGIVYLTDALQSKRVQVLGAFPADSHPPIVYPAACLKGGGESAREFLKFITSPAGAAVWKKYGFEKAQP